MTRLIGTRCKRSNVLSRGVLISRVSYWETCKSSKGDAIPIFNNWGFVPQFWWFKAVATPGHIPNPAVKHRTTDGTLYGESR